VKKLVFAACLLWISGLALLCSDDKKAHAMEGSGTEAEPYIIKTPEDLSDIRNDMGAYYKLGADIDLAGYDYDGAGPDTGGWKPIGNSSFNAFTGTLNGNGFAILNMTINRPDENYVGLFGWVGHNGKLVNIRLLDVNVIGRSTAGSLAGILNGTLEDAYSTGRVQALTDHAGGLVGSSSGGTIRNSFAAVDVTTPHRAGGLAGINQGVIENVFAVGSVRGNDEVGGLVGYNAQAPSGQVVIQNAYAAGKVTGNVLTGGLIGRFFDGATVEHAFWNTETSGQSSSARGTGITTEQMKDADTFAAWDPAVWGFHDGKTFPYLLSFPLAIGVDPLVPTTYGLHPGQDALSVTGSIHHHSAGEPINVRYVIRDDAGVVVEEHAEVLTSDGNGDLPIKRKFWLSALTFDDGDYTLTITATDTRHAVAGITLGFTVDTAAPAPPSVVFGTNGQEVWAQTASTSVTVYDSGSGVDASSLQYAWSPDPVTPAPGSGWTSFVSGETLSKSGVDGDWYLHIRAKDVTGSLANVVSKRFRLDNTPPEVDFAPNGNAAPSQTAETTVTVSDAASGVDAASLQYVWTQSADVPAGGWTDFASGDTLSKSGVEGDWYLHIRAQDALGNSIDAVSNVFVLKKKNPAVYVPVNAAIRPFIDLNGVMLDPSVIDTSQSSFILEVTPRDNTAYVGIPASLLTDIAEKNSTFIIEIKAPYGSFRVPVELASLIPGLDDLLAAHHSDIRDIAFRITLIDKTGDGQIRDALASQWPNGIVMGAAVDFLVDVVNIKTGEKLGMADRFAKALTRVIPMPASVTDMPEHWGAFRYDETAERFEFVPARAVEIDGVWYVTIRSYSNSVYVTLRNAATFGDVERHWGRAFIDLAAAKGLVEGVGDGKFVPDKPVTRAEFVSMLVRALGRGTVKGTEAPYDDVKPGAWYFDAVVTAKELGLLNFVSGARFIPEQPLTREEMASLLAAAVALEQPPAAADGANLDGYRDLGAVNAAYLDDIRLVVKLNIMIGTSGDTFSPKGESTRAQAAVVLIRTLRTLGMMD